MLILQIHALSALSILSLLYYLDTFEKYIFIMKNY